MNFRIAVLVFILLPGCGYFGQNAGQKSVPYKYSSAKVAPDQYEAVIGGEPGVDVEMLKTAFKAEGTALCADKVYLLRGMREETIPSENRHELRGTIDCVGLDYFQ